MAEGLLQGLPKAGPLLEGSAAVEGRLEALSGTFAALDPKDPESPLVTVGSVVAGLGLKLDIDVSGLEKLKGTIGVIQNSLPPSALEYVEAIEEAYETAHSFLQDNPLAREVAEGSTLQQAALAVIQEALDLFDERIEELDLIDADTLDTIREALDAIEDLRSDFPAHRDELLEFLTNNLLGVGPDLLREPLQHLEAAYAVLAPLDEDALSQSLDPARADLSEALDRLVADLEVFDPAEAEGYARLQLRLDALEGAIRDTVAAVSPVYGQLQTLVEHHAWDDIFSSYRTLLQAVALERPATVDTVTDEMAAVLEQLLAQLYMTFGAEELTERIETLNLIIRDAFATSGLGRVSQTIRVFLGDIQGAIEGVPTQEIQTAVEGMLEQVGQELDDLGVDGIKENFSKALDEARKFVTDNIDEGLTEAVRVALESVVSTVTSLGLDDLLSELAVAVDQLDALILKLDEALKEHMDDLTDLLSQLDTLSFQPVGDRVIEQIDELRDRLKAIDPNSLSDAEKFALRAALAVIEEIDLEGRIIAEVKHGYAGVEGQIKVLLNDLARALEELRDGVGAFDPEKVLGPVNQGLKLVSDGAGRLNGRTMVDPLREQVGGFVKKLEGLSPGELLDPLQAPYDEMMQVVGRLDPARWLAPLDEVYRQIDGLISLVDITPLLEELDEKQKELLGKARTAIVDALDDLPEPLNGFFSGLKPVLESVTDAIFGDPDAELRRIGVEINTGVSLRRLSEPLDEVFGELLEMVESVPPDDLTGVANSIREGIGVGLDSLDPNVVIRHLRAGQARLAALDPGLLLGVPLPRLRVAFQARAEAAPAGRQEDAIAVSGRFDAVISLVATQGDESLLQPLIEAHDALEADLRRRINTLDASGANEAYGALREDLDRVLPPFLRSPVPLTREDVLAGLGAMRPSMRFDRVEEVLERFLRQIEPLEDALQPAIDDFFAGIREVLSFVSPLDLRDSVEDIYDAIREKARVLDPTALADSIRENVLNRLTEGLEQIDPSAIKSEIDEAYRGTLAAVQTTVTKVLDDISKVLEENLKSIRQKIQGLLQQAKETISGTVEQVAGIRDRLERLVFVEFLERLERVIENLHLSFDEELDRIREAFDEMLAATPLGTAEAAV